MAQRSRALYQVIQHVRSTFHQLKALGDELHADRGITTAMRAVMESLAEAGEQTVPHMARAKSVSRQHIQINVDMLAKAGHVRLRNNPGHKRSPLINLTRKGRATFASMRRREQAPLERIVKEFRLKELFTASDTLARLKHRIVAVRTKGGTDD